MFQKSIKKALRETLIQLSEHYNLDKTDVLKVYLNETSTNMNLTKYQYLNYTLLKDCFNNLYIINDTNKLELMGYINDNNQLVFDELIKKKLKPEEKEEKEESIIIEEEESIIIEEESIIIEEIEYNQIDQEESIK